MGNRFEIWVGVAVGVPLGVVVDFGVGVRVGVWVGVECVWRSGSKCVEVRDRVVVGCGSRWGSRWR